MQRNRDKGAWAVRAMRSPAVIIGALAAFGSIGVIESSSIGVAQDNQAINANSATNGNVEGRVTSTIDVPGYTYVEVETAEGAVWAAAPGVAIQVGDTVSFSTSMPMRRFYSKALQREFDVIYFVDRFDSDDGQLSIDSVAAAAHGRTGQQMIVAPVTGIGKAEGGYTIAEIYARSDELAGQRLRVRGQVVRFTAGVMNTNWIRVRDGSTTEELVVPTDATAAMNDIILVEGRFVADLDLGQGYVLPAILEDAVITFE